MDYVQLLDLAFVLSLFTAVFANSVETIISEAAC